MAKKRKSRGQAPGEPKPFNASDAKLGAINTFEDVADSEDEFHINRDKVLLDEGPEAKRRRKWEEQERFLELSDEEVLGYASEDSDEEEDELDDNNFEESRADLDLGSGSEREEQDENAEGWGSSKRDYYNADNIETEADALEEEAEAKRLQQKKLQKMSEADFGFDENEWLGEDHKEDEGDVVTEILKDVEITSEMGPDERLRLLQTRYPEFESLANEFVELQPLFATVHHDGTATQKEVNKIKSRALGAYMGALTMYFALFTSHAKTENGISGALNPAELHDHGIMESLLRCREMWSKVKSLKAPKAALIQPVEIFLGEISDGDESQPAAAKLPKESRRESAKATAAGEVAARRAARIKAAEEDLADLSSLMPKYKKVSKPKIKKASLQIREDDSDFGEEESLDARSAAEKAAKKKSLRFYTSQIAQKASRRADAGRGAGGDADLPYRERLKDRQARLNAEAEKRGGKSDKHGRGAALGEDSGSDGGEDTAAAVRDEADEYYDMVAKTSKMRKDDKNERFKAIAEAKAKGARVRVVEGEVGEDGKRAIGYVIEKNKGLAPKRKKDVRNPRVKKRKMYEAKKKKLSSIRAVYKGGEERGGYGGEKTGIKTGLVKSIKL